MNSTTCGICTVEYNNEKNLPIFLPCGHTFCKKCLKEVYQKNSFLICPEDGKKLYLALDHYPTNHLILKKVQANKTSNKKVVKPTEGPKHLNKSVTLKESTENVKKEISRRGSQLNETSDISSIRTARIERVSGTSLEDESIFEKSYRFNEDDELENYLNSEITAKKEERRFKQNSFQSSTTDDFSLVSLFDFASQINKETNKDNSAFSQTDLNKSELEIDKSFITKKTDKSAIVKEYSSSKISKYEENIIFSYFIVMKNIIRFFDDNKDDNENVILLSEQTYIETDECASKQDSAQQNKEMEKKEYVQFIMRLIVFIILLVINYLVIANEMFLRVYMFIILANDSKRSMKSSNIKKLSLCAKRWLSFAVVIMLEEWINRTSWLLHPSILNLITMFPIKRLWNCFLVIYVLLITGPIGGLNYIVLKIVKYLNKFKILLK